MIRTQLQSALTAAGCTLVLYESTQLANVIADQSKPSDIVGLALEPDSITLAVKGNGIQEIYPPTIVEIFKQVRPEDTALNNEATLQELLTACKKFIHSLIRTGNFQKLDAVICTKITEKHYDANVIGWSMALNLRPIENRQSC